jgi:protein-disulfide isomerase
VSKYQGKVKVVYKHFVVHPDTVMDAHLAACAANKQGKFKEFKNVFWEDGFEAYAASRDPSHMAKENLIKMAAKVGLKKAQFEKDMAGDACKDRLVADQRELTKFGVGGTPSFFVNGKHTMFRGPAEFFALVEAELAEVEKSGVAGDKYYQEVVMGKGYKKFRSKKDAAQ